MEKVQLILEKIWIAFGVFLLGAGIYNFSNDTKTQTMMTFTLSLFAFLMYFFRRMQRKKRAARQQQKSRFER